MEGKEEAEDKFKSKSLIYFCHQRQQQLPPDSSINLLLGRDRIYSAHHSGLRSLSQLALRLVGIGTEKDRIRGPMEKKTNLADM